MEYLNVIVIGNVFFVMELEIVIVYEVGYNWFYGILGFNECVYGWMDEGMNILNEQCYVYMKYLKNIQFFDMLMGGKFYFYGLL